MGRSPPMNNETMNEKARAAVRQLAAGSSLNAVARLIGVPQPTLHRFLTKEGAALSLKNFEKIAPYISKETSR